MKNFQAWFTEKHGFWPARPNEHTPYVLARLCNEVAEFIDEIARRGDCAEISPTPLVEPPLTVSYINYRGEISLRTITPLKPWYGSTEWHPVPQWLLKAYDHDKLEERDFALADFGARAPAVKLELIRTVSDTPLTSHGGLVATITWELILNDVLIRSDSGRVRWGDREKAEIEPPSELRELRDSLKEVLENE